MGKIVRSFYEYFWKYASPSEVLMRAVMLLLLPGLILWAGVYTAFHPWVPANDLERAANAHTGSQDTFHAFIAGAEWQKEKTRGCVRSQIELYGDLCAESSTGYEDMEPSDAHRAGVKCSSESALMCLEESP